MNEDDPEKLVDPLWYDRVEPDVPPGALLNAAAYMLLLVMAGFRIAISVYWLPDTLWSRTIRRIARYRAARN
ncbi:hypothetical protein MKK88_09925 [Methylobacterium sp. E-005]|uniref:hypothetical protein n=1 Tax=Methylobacterium sp. E-005 TaxID=2836549 RepID=UPI001FBA876C|nr:hypothetical protein [Methylobacterium sp. E-005]MCJ2086309.1 hypothetical protein [Methylobacterium sp. E-005]